MYRFEGRIWIRKKIRIVRVLIPVFPYPWGTKMDPFGHFKKRETHLHTRIQRPVVES